MAIWLARRANRGDNMLQARVIDLQDDILVIQRPGARVRVKATVIIGADGPLSPVARLCGWPRPPLAAAAQVEVSLLEKLEVTRVYFEPPLPGWLRLGLP
jgi:flavin-dependent dehydrogenase